MHRATAGLAEGGATGTAAVVPATREGEIEVARTAVAILRALDILKTC